MSAHEITTTDTSHFFSPVSFFCQSPESCSHALLEFLICSSHVSFQWQSGQPSLEPAQTHSMIYQ